MPVVWNEAGVFLGFTVAHDRIAEIDLIANPDKLRAVAVEG